MKAKVITIIVGLALLKLVSINIPDDIKKIDPVPFISEISPTEQISVKYTYLAKVKKIENSHKQPDEHLEKINNYRIANRLQPIVSEDSTCKYAQTRLIETKTDWSHSKFLTERSNRLGGTWVENLARTANETNVLDAWINSPTHKQMLLADIKYGCIANQDGYWVFIGWKPLASPVSR